MGSLNIVYCALLFVMTSGDYHNNWTNGGRRPSSGRLQVVTNYEFMQLKMQCHQREMHGEEDFLRIHIFNTAVTEMVTQKFALTHSPPKMPYVAV